MPHPLPGRRHLRGSVLRLGDRGQAQGSGRQGHRHAGPGRALRPGRSLRPATRGRDHRPDAHCPGQARLRPCLGQRVHGRRDHLGRGVGAARAHHEKDRQAPAPVHLLLSGLAEVCRDLLSGTAAPLLQLQVAHRHDGSPGQDLRGRKTQIRSGPDLHRVHHALHGEKVRGPAPGKQRQRAPRHRRHHQHPGTGLPAAKGRHRPGQAAGRQARSPHGRIHRRRHHLRRVRRRHGSGPALRLPGPDQKAARKLGLQGHAGAWRHQGSHRHHRRHPGQGGRGQRRQALRRGLRTGQGRQNRPTTSSSSWPARAAASWAAASPSCPRCSPAPTAN